MSIIEDSFKEVYPRSSESVKVRRKKKRNSEKS